MSTIKVQQVPGATQYVEAEEGHTVDECIAAAGFPTNGWAVSVSNDPIATLNSVVKEGATIMMTREAKGA